MSSFKFKRNNFREEQHRKQIDKKNGQVTLVKKFIKDNNIKIDKYNKLIL